MQKLRDLYREPLGFTIDLFLFAVITILFHKLWRAYSLEIHNISWVKEMGNRLADLVFVQSLWVNKKVLGLHITTEAPNIMWFANGGYVQVNMSCSGLKQFYQVFVLFLLFPGQWRHKLWFIPMSIIVMHLVNVFRIVMLSLMVLWKPEYWDFTHDWILRPFFYIVVFVLWVWWVEKFKNNGQ